MKDDNSYIKYEEEADEYVNKILLSDAPKKVIVAGPGTGKSHLFEQLCKANIAKDKTKNLVLSFINELVNDLAKDLYKLAEVRTLHSFALSQLPKDNKFYLYLGNVIEQDYNIINGNEIDYTRLLCNLIDSQNELEFYSKRRKYYNHFSPNCSVYTLIKYYEQDQNKIPVYSQIMIDEYQDFNKLEAMLIELLAKKNSILIVGDDDQSLYGFKYANPDEIRVKSAAPDYTTFELPFCFRCTEVIMRSFENITRQAKQLGYLKTRLEKPFRYFPNKDKDKLSHDNPKICVKTDVHQTMVAYTIESEMSKLYHPNDRHMSVLIICSLKKQIPKLANMLADKGFRNIHFRDDKEPQVLMEGFALLLKDKESNLGWRIVSKYIMEKENKNSFEDVVGLSVDQGDTQFKDLLPKKVVKYIKSILAILRKVKNKKTVTYDECVKLFECFDCDPASIAIQKFRNDLADIGFRKEAYKDIPLKITTILGSKGLTSSYVFLVNFDDKYLLEKNGKIISDESICKFLVALTRAKRRVYVYSNGSKLPVYIDWIDKTNYEMISQS